MSTLTIFWLFWPTRILDSEAKPFSRIWCDSATMETGAPQTSPPNLIMYAFVIACCTWYHQVTTSCMLPSRIHLKTWIWSLQLAESWISWHVQRSAMHVCTCMYIGIWHYNAIYSYTLHYYILFLNIYIYIACIICLIY